MRGFDLDLLAQPTLICFICCASLVAPTNLSITLYKFKKAKKKGQWNRRRQHDSYFF